MTTENNTVEEIAEEKSYEYSAKVPEHRNCYNCCYSDRVTESAYQEGFKAGHASRQQEVDELKAIIERGDEIKNNWENNCYQEATHYNWLDDQNEKLQSQLAKANARIERLRGALNTLKVAVNDKQPDPGAVWFISRTLTQDNKDSESTDQPKAKWDITKHIHGKVYDLTQENMNAMIADIERMIKE